MKIKIFQYIGLIFCVCFTTHVLASSLTTQEKRIQEYVIKQKQSQVALLKKLVNINSGTSNPQGVHKVGEIVRAEFNRLGFKTRWVALPANMHHAGTLIAERKGNKGKKILLIGHLDTVFPADGKFQRFVAEKNVAKGPGALDDKGGVVVILYALKALHAQHGLDGASITVVLTGDEEDSGKPTSISRKPLLDAAKNSDIALDFEGSISLTTSTIARRGITNWRIETEGKEAHSATIFQKDVGDGAIFEMARILNRIREEVLLVNGTTFNPGVITGGTKVTFDKKKSKGNAFGKQNVVAKQAVADGDFRFLTIAQQQSLKEKMTAIVSQHLPGTKAAITFEDAIPAMAPTTENLDLLKEYSAVSDDLGYGPVKPLPPEMRGAGDISHVAAIVRANLAGLGPTGFGAHSAAETVELDSLPIQTSRTAILLYRLTR